MVNNATNINKANNHLSSQTIESKHNLHIITVMVFCFSSDILNYKFSK